MKLFERVFGRGHLAQSLIAIALIFLLVISSSFEPVAAQSLGAPNSFATRLSEQTADQVRITGGTIQGVTISGAISPSTVRTSAAVTANATTTYADVTGLSQTVVAGTYKFTAFLPSTVASGTGGIKYAFNYTGGAALSSIEATSQGYTASTVAVQHTTTATSQADLFSQAAVVIFVQIEGTMVVSSGGTITLQMAQNTSNASNTVALVGGTLLLTRIA